MQYNYLDKLDAIALDLQRSMDYYESQLGKSPCLKVIVLPQQDLESPIMRTLIENMGAEITTINLNNIISVEEELSIELRHHCFIAIAGALRLDQKVKK
jgi:MSHA biogenesis protein MshI